MPVEATAANVRGGRDEGYARRSSIHRWIVVDKAMLRPDRRHAEIDICLNLGIAMFGVCGSPLHPAVVEPNDHQSPVSVGKSDLGIGQLPGRNPGRLSL